MLTACFVAPSCHTNTCVDGVDDTASKLWAVQLLGWASHINTSCTCHAKHALLSSNHHLCIASDLSACGIAPTLLCRAMAGDPTVKCFQSPWVRTGHALLLLVGLILPTIAVAFGPFKWTSLVVQLLFVQSYWSIHEMSRAMEERFLCDLSEHQVLGCCISPL